jgi:natural product precursor
MKRFEKKLALNKETISNLKSAEMKVLKGGCDTLRSPCILSDMCVPTKYTCPIETDLTCQ